MKPKHEWQRGQGLVQYALIPILLGGCALLVTLGVLLELGVPGWAICGGGLLIGLGLWLLEKLANWLRRLR